jgi:histone acetyltransferase (RNA polymerase elongator complex component)
MNEDGTKVRKKNKPLIIPIFIMNSGCPHRCIFCNQKITAGNFPPEITKEIFDREVASYLNWNRDKSRRVEIAFYGGSFTGVRQDYQEQLLLWANEYIRKGLVHSIRISTRPDYITSDILSFLKKYNVTIIEIGAQSFVDNVLQLAQRGHSAADSINAINLAKKAGFQTGLHLMVGLPGDTQDGLAVSLKNTIDLRPDTVRIHPVVVFNDTVLATDFQQGNYEPLSLTEAVNLCKMAWYKLSAAGIRIIRTGLQMTKEMNEDDSVIAGPLHPAFGNLVLSALYFEETINLLSQLHPTTSTISFKIHNYDVSNFRGWQNNNIKAIKNLYPLVNIDVEPSRRQKRGEISVITDQGHFLNTVVPGIARFDQID